MVIGDRQQWDSYFKKNKITNNTSPSPRKHTFLPHHTLSSPSSNLFMEKGNKHTLLLHRDNTHKGWCLLSLLLSAHLSLPLPSLSPKEL